MKYSFKPSGVMNGSASLYWPENSATEGVPHLPCAQCETTIVQKLKLGLLFKK
jgi:deoxycytidylate deaminase